MRKRNLPVLFRLLLVNTLCHAQTLGDVNRAKSITWYGIDFSQAAGIPYMEHVCV